MTSTPRLSTGATGEAVRAALMLALVTAILAETLRVSFPLLYDFAGRIGFTTAAWVVPLIFAIPLLAAPLGAVIRPAVLAAVGVVGLVVARIVMQVQDTPGLPVAMAGALLGLVGLAAAWRRAVAVTGTTAGAAFFAGLAVDTTVRIGLTTWDAAWQSSAVAWLVGLGLPTVLGGLVVAELRKPDASDAAGPDAVGPAVVPAALLALQTLFLANPAFVASSGRIGLPLAGTVVLVGLAGAAATTMAPTATRGRWVWAVTAAGLLLVAAASTGPTGVTGPPLWAAVVIGQVCAAALLARAAWRGGGPDNRAVRTGFGAGLGSLALVAVLLPYQISYEIPLGVPQATFAALAALIIAAISWRATDLDRPATSIALAWAAVVIPLAALVVPLWSALTWPEIGPSTRGRDEVRVATYNIHSAVSATGALDPEGIAQVLDDGGADVVMLQEVARGWPLAGGLDAAAWLSRRLGAAIAYGDAADHQFGNAVLSTYPITRSWTGTMDRGEGTMQRGYVGATIPVGGTTLDVWSTHLQHQDHTTATRQAQARQVLDAWSEVGQSERTVIGGDLNSRPGSPDIEPWFDGTGLVSAQDVAGDPTWNTSPADAPRHRIDWIFGTPDVQFADAAIPQALASDHLPVFVTVTVPAR